MRSYTLHHAPRFPMDSQLMGWIAGIESNASQRNWLSGTFFGCGVRLRTCVSQVMGLWAKPEWRDQRESGGISASTNGRNAGIRCTLH